MPTITWIQERGEERFEQPLNIVLTSTRGCPFCPRFFESPDAQETSRLLVHHIGRDHPLQRPIIAVGNQILGPNATITLLPKPDDIAIENTTSIQVEVDGDRRRTVTATEVATLLSQRTRRFLRLWLRNARSGRFGHNSRLSNHYRRRRARSS